MTFKEYYRSLSAIEKRRLARFLRTTVPYLNHIAFQRRLPGFRLCQKIEDYSEGQVTRHELRPDIYPPE